MGFRIQRLKKEHFFSALLLAILIGIFIGVYSTGLEQLRSNLNDEGILSELSIFTLRFTSVLIPALPSTAYSLLSGGLFGFKKGLVLICSADIVSCSLCFFLAKYYGRKLVTRLVGKKFMNKVEKFSSRNIESNFFLITGLLMTGLFDFVSYGIGLTKTSWRMFLPALLVSIAISNPPIVALGSGALEGGKKILIISAIGVLLLGLITNKIKKSASKESRVKI